MIGREERILAVRYAQAFLNVQEKYLSQAECQALHNVVHYYHDMPFLLFYLQMPLFTEENKKAALTAVRNFYELPQVLEKLDSLLLEHARIFLLPLVYGELIRQSQMRAGYTPCAVITATTLSEHEKYMCMQLVVQISEKKPLITWQVDPSLIAGIKIQTENWLWEDSLDARLRALANTLLI